MEWWQALVLGIMQGLTEFLPVSSSGHLMIFRELLGVDADGFLDFTVTVHFATVLSTIIVFWSVILRLLKGFFKFRYNDETDYILKLIVSMIPIGIVGLFFKDKVEGLFSDDLFTVGVCLVVTAVLLAVSDQSSRWVSAAAKSAKQSAQAGNPGEQAEKRNGLSYLQAFIVGLGQACAVAPGLSRSGTTIATGLICGVKRENMAQFSFLMVLAPIIGEQLLDILKGLNAPAQAAGLGFMPLFVGFLGAFFSGLLSCKAMVAIVKKAKLVWFSVYCLLAAIAIFIFA